MANQKNDDGFHVRLDGIKFSEAAKSRIQASIQKIIMNELAGYYPNPDSDEKPIKSHYGDGVVIVPPNKWWGFIVRQLQPVDINGIKGLKDVANTELHGR